MRWEKKGLIFKVDKQYEWMSHHAGVPVVDRVNDEVLRIYFGPRDTSGRSHVAFIEVEADNPAEVLYVHDQPLLSPGQLGTFDDSGTTPCSIVNHGGKKYLYYVGWNASVTVPYRNAIGVAISEDEGITFRRLFEGPVVDRNKREPYFCASPFVMVDDDERWRIWYVSSTGWTIVHRRPEPLYQVKYGESRDGLNWVRNNVTCLEYRFEGEANARPCVIKENGCYRMWYCFRGSLDYRTNREQSYRIGYAESSDGIKWLRKDDEVGIERSDSGWDSVMMAYPYVYVHKGRKYMVYNGNGFGETGFGYAVLQEDG
jgi:predicted GH43/DUF377 family glycosyl hydrolase